MSDVDVAPMIQPSIVLESRPHTSASVEAGATQSAVRTHNLRSIALSVVFTSGKMSRADIADSTGLNRSTVTRLVERLITSGIVRESSERIVGTGRPAIVLEAARRTHVAIALEIAPDHLAATMLDFTGTHLSDLYRAGNIGALEPDAALREAGSLLANLVSQAKATRMNVVCVTVCVSGLINAADGRLLYSPHLGWRDVALRDPLRHAIGGEDIPLYFYNSATMGAVAEQVARMKSGATYESFLFITGSAGVGSVNIRDGSVVPGAHGWAGELGHVMVSEEDRICYCGARGCLDAFIGKEALMRDAGLPADAPWSRLSAMLARQEPDACEALEKAGHYLGRALAGTLNMIDADTVVVGGMLGQLFPYAKAGLEAELRERVLSAPWNTVHIEQSLLADSSSLVGAAWFGLLDFLNTPSRWKSLPDFRRDYHMVDDNPSIFVE